MSFAMGITLYQNLTTIIFVSFFFAGPFSSSAQPNERPDQLWDYPYDDNYPKHPTTPQPPNDNKPPERGTDVSPSLPPPNIFNTTNFQPSPPPPPLRESSNLNPPLLAKFRNTTGELPSSDTRELNLGKKFGLAFLAVAVVLQILLGGFLMYKRRKIANL